MSSIAAYTIHPTADPDTVDVSQNGIAHTVHREDADPEHRLIEYRLAAAYFGNAPQPAAVDPDWQGDADNYRDAAFVDTTWRAWDASGRQIGYSDASITGAQAAAMFEAIGRTP